MRSNVISTEGNQLISKSCESAVNGADFFTLVSFESIEFASECVNSGILLGRNTFTNLFKIVPDTFGRWNILHFMIFFWCQMIGDENANFIIKINQFCFFRSDGLLIGNSDSIQDNLPGGRVDSHDISLHLVLPVWVVLPIENRNRFAGANSCERHT